MRTKRAVEGEVVQHPNGMLLFSRSSRLANLLQKTNFQLGVLPRIRRVGTSDFEDDVISSSKIFISEEEEVMQRREMYTESFESQIVQRIP